MTRTTPLPGLDPVAHVESADTLHVIVSGAGPQDLAQLGAVRRAVRALVSGWAPRDVTDDVVLVASELVANALRHRQPPLTGAGAEVAHPADRVHLGVCQDGDDIVLFVCDPSPEAPVPRRDDPLRLNGRGLELVTALSSTWGWTPGRWVGRRRAPSAGGQVGSGKTVWAMFRAGSAVG